MKTSYWHPDGTPMAAAQFLQLMYGDLPAFFHDEAELRAIWIAPDTRSKLLEGLAEKGFGLEQMTEMRRIIHTEKSNLFDVLAYVAYALPTLKREERWNFAKVEKSFHRCSEQQAFLEFVQAHCVSEGVQELDQAKLTSLLRLRCNNSIADAAADIGETDRDWQGVCEFLAVSVSGVA